MRTRATGRAKEVEAALALGVDVNASATVRALCPSGGS
jgi:hypothetical protein